MVREDNIEAIYPLSPLQQGMLFHSNYAHRSGVYVESLTFRLHGSLDAVAFRNAWQKVVERHSALRTSFVWENRETPLQVVRKQVDLPWQEFDWRHLSEADQQAQLGVLLKEDHEQGYDLSRVPLLRLVLIQLSADIHQFVWSYHHIVLDGWSITIILDEVFSLYRSWKQNSDIRLRQPQPYKTYINWLRQQDLSAAQAFWTERMHGFSELTSLNLDEPAVNEAHAGAGFDSQQITLPRQTTAALKSFAYENKLTLNTLFQGAWALLLSSYSGEDDIVFGAAVSGRSIPLAGIESMVGLMIGSQPVRVQIPAGTALVPWLERLQEQQVQARQFEYSSLRDIQAWSEIDRSRGQTLFDTILSFNNYDFNEVLKAGAGGLEISDVQAREGSHYPITVLIDPGQEIRIRINYDCTRFDGAVVRRILGHLQVLLEGMPVHPSQAPTSLSLLSLEEEHKLLVDFNHTDAPLPGDRLVLHLFEEQVQQAPEAVALRHGERTLTYGQLSKQTNQLARLLKKQGVGPEQVVAICLDRSPEAVLAIWGTLKAGGAYLPLDSNLPARRLELMLEETGAPVILTNRRLAKNLPATNARVLLLDADWEAVEAESDASLAPSAGPENMAYIIYTSGSTGRPKGTIVRHRNLLNYVSWARDFYLQGKKLDFPLFSSLSFDLTVTSIYVPLISGGCIVIYGESDTPNMEILRVIQDDLVDIIKLTPAHLTLLLAANIRSKRLRKMIVGGEDLKRSLAKGIRDLFEGRVDIFNEYGPTEATVGCMIHRFDPETDMDASVPIGRPIRNAQVYILDRHFRPVPPGVIGEMCIGGEGVARGYLHRPDLTEAKFVNDPWRPGSTLYRTGDLARWTPDGRMQFLGRSDHQVKIKGYRIELGEIESNLLEHPEIELAVVIAFQPDSKAADRITQRCVRCGLPDNYPGVTFDSSGVCNTCRDFAALKDRFRTYFKTPAELRVIVEKARQLNQGKYDALVLFSGGKDSTFMLYQLVQEYGLRPLVFSLENGYISEEAKANIRRVTEALGVDLVWGQTPHMNAVFADSLKRHSNVCNGCFKVIYTLSISLAHSKGIRYIFTGLSRGQLFETRLSDMFHARIFDEESIDRTVLAARRAYHRIDDAVTQLLDVKVFEDEQVFNQVQLVDFFRYVDVPLQEMYQYLEQTAHWTRPSDTGRSTNCLINDVGIYIHKKERGYHNYALPYSWDVRMGQKTRDEAVDELNDDIDQQRVHRILSEIGYDETEAGGTRLAAYYVSGQPMASSSVRAHLEKTLPGYMIPTYIVPLDRMPLTQNGKIDRKALPPPESGRTLVETAFVKPETAVEIKLAEIWAEVLHVQEIGVHDNFFDLGGDSISTIHVVMRIAQAFQVNLLPVELFDTPTISRLAQRIENLLLAEIEQLTDEEAAALLSSDETSQDG